MIILEFKSGHIKEIEGFGYCIKDESILVFTNSGTKFFLRREIENVEMLKEGECHEN